MYKGVVMSLLKPHTLQSVHDDAIKHLQEVSHLFSADYQRIGCATLQEAPASVDNTVTQNTCRAKIRGVFKSLLERLGKFEKLLTCWRNPHGKSWVLALLDSFGVL
jgi:hypothetical protein